MSRRGTKRLWLSAIVYLALCVWLGPTVSFWLTVITAWTIFLFWLCGSFPVLGMFTSAFLSGFVGGCSALAAADITTAAIEDGDDGGEFSFAGAYQYSSQWAEHLWKAAVNSGIASWSSPMHASRLAVVAAMLAVPCIAVQFLCCESVGWLEAGSGLISRIAAHAANAPTGCRAAHISVPLNQVPALAFSDGHARPGCSRRLPVFVNPDGSGTAFVAGQRTHSQPEIESTVGPSAAGVQVSVCPSGINEGPQRKQLLAHTVPAMSGGYPRPSEG